MYRAREAIAGRLHRTPMFTSATLSQLSGAQVHLKAELFQRTGSFKPRGVLTKLASLTPRRSARRDRDLGRQPRAGARVLRRRSRASTRCVVMWQGASESKIARRRGYGADGRPEALDPTEAFAGSSSSVEETGRTLVHPFDDPLTQAGQGTVGLELLEDVPRRTSSSSRSAAAA